LQQLLMFVEAFGHGTIGSLFQICITGIDGICYVDLVSLSLFYLFSVLIRCPCWLAYVVMFIVIIVIF